MTRLRIDVLVGVLAALTLAWLALVWSAATLGPAAAGFSAFANVVQVAMVALAAGLALDVHRRLDAENPARAAWLLIALGFAAFTVAESADAGYEVLAGMNRPFPSALDGVFLGAYALIGLAFLAFVRSYSGSVLISGGLGPHRTAALAFGFLLAAAGSVILKALLADGGLSLDRAVSASYPALDLVALLPAFVLVRITVAFRGGGVWSVWAALLAGFGLTCAADFIFAYFTVRGVEGHDALMETLYLLSYAAFARGSNVQRGLLA